MDRTWIRSSYSSSTKFSCVEVSHEPPATAVRDSKDPDGPVLTFSPAAFGKFLRRLGES